MGAALGETASEGSTVLVAGARLEERDPGRAARAAAGLRALGDVRGALAATGAAMRRTMAGGGRGVSGGSAGGRAADAYRCAELG